MRLTQVLLPDSLEEGLETVGVSLQTADSGFVRQNSRNRVVYRKT